MMVVAEKICRGVVRSSDVSRMLPLPENVVVVAFQLAGSFSVPSPLEHA